MKHALPKKCGENLFNRDSKESVTLGGGEPTGVAVVTL